MDNYVDNYGILVEILSRLPVKSLLRFMSVSEQWKTLISSHPFRKVHREKNTSSFPLLIASYNVLSTESVGNIQIPEIPTLDPDPELGTCTRTHLITYNLEGNIIEQFDPPFPPKFFSMSRPPYKSKLLCFYRELLPSEFYLYNPSTRQSFLLPNPYPFSSSNRHCGNPPPELQIHLRVELGYIPSKDEYIMVHLVMSHGKVLCEVLYISISDDNFKLHYNNWRTIESKDVRIGCVFSRSRSGVFIDGVFYWQAITYPENRHMLSFDLEKEQFLILNYPQYPSSGTTLLEIHGKLYIANFPLGPTYLVLWKLCSENKSWAIHWEFDYERLFGFQSSVPPIWLGFRSDLFIYYLKYIKGYEEQPRDEQVSAEMGKLSLPDGLDIIMTWIDVAVHTNLCTL